MAVARMKTPAAATPALLETTIGMTTIATEPMILLAAFQNRSRRSCKFEDIAKASHSLVELDGTHYLADSWGLVEKGWPCSV